MTGRCSSRRSRGITTTTISACRRSAPCRCSTTAPVSRPTRSSTTRRPSACVPMAYLPYMSTPDPTVKRKTGFLMPSYTSTTGYGFGVETPFYWAMAPDYDMTFSPRITTRQGPLLQAEFRQRLLDGAYSIKGYGIYQLDPGAYAGQPGDRNWRGGVDTHGQFALNDKWVWGWD